MKILQSVLLGLLQGLTEFIPVSSSGHMVLLKHYLKFESDFPLLLEVSLHMGTLIAVILVYRRKLLDLLGYFILSAPRKCREKGLRSGLWEDDRGKTILLFILACIPTAIIGLLFKDLFERLFSNILWTSVALIVTGIVLFSTRWIPETVREKREPGVFIALIIGLVQGLAIMPGLSRSGSTISSGMWGGMNRSVAADFSFLLSIPAIIGAFVLVIKDISYIPFKEIPSIIAGFSVAVISGYLSLRFLLKYIRKGGLHRFAWYCWFIGLASLVGYYL
jgi:undecaprenyl-diphosphatase